VDPASGRLFGVIGNVKPSEERPAFVLAGSDPDFSRWYTLQWLKCQGFGKDTAEADGSQRAAY
jgi:hypothetical protein